MNDIIHLLTNRDSGFASTFLDKDRYVPKVGDHQLFRAADTLRKLLGLDKTGTDWYWKPLHMAILHDKQFCSYFDTSTTMRPHTHSFVAPQFFNGKVSGVTNRPILTWKPLELPESFEFTLTLQDVNSASYVNGKQYGVVPCSVSQNVVLVPDLSVLMPGAEFGIISSQPIEPGLVVGWSIEPTRYPAAHVLQVLQSTHAFNLLMAAYHVQDLYSAIPDDLFRLGLVGTLIARATADHGQ
jgi:hypothetical protein